MRSAATGSVVPFFQLQGTLVEVVAIEDAMNAAGWEVTSLKREEASEQRLKSQFDTNPPEIVHLATHGFAFPQAQVEDQTWEALYGTIRTAEDPLLRSGLLLSGGNYAWMGAKEVLERTGEDGLLVAAELAEMNLQGVRLAVLSACETAVGEQGRYEGTMGMFRALRMAGVDEVVHSFWSVPDHGTQALMKRFYEELAHGRSPQDALGLAMNWMRNRHPNRPHEWAGFTIMR
jgi:CHAT domain-containing protein